EIGLEYIVANLRECSQQLWCRRQSAELSQALSIGSTFVNHRHQPVKESRDWNVQSARDLRKTPGTHTVGAVFILLYLLESHSDLLGEHGLGYIGALSERANPLTNCYVGSIRSATSHVSASFDSFNEPQQRRPIGDDRNFNPIQTLKKRKCRPRFSFQKYGDHREAVVPLTPVEAYAGFDFLPVTESARANQGQHRIVLVDTLGNI